MLMVPLSVIGPPVSPAPVAMLVTVPPELASFPQLTVPTGPASGSMRRYGDVSSKTTPVASPSTASIIST